MLHRSCILLCLLLLAPALSHAQKERNIWYFGDNAGLDFNSGAPVARTDGALKTVEGCTSICDKDGKLLFYSDGTAVWNKNHAIMLNGSGLSGHWSSTQSGIIMPKPGTTGLYYLFTADCVERNLANGVRYSLIDMSRDNGRGEVIQKNILVHTPVTERITAIPHKNKRDFWVLVHEWGSNVFRSYLVDKDGVHDSEPVLSPVGAVYRGNFTNAIGYMKASPAANKVAIASTGMQRAELFDFDNATGVLSNTIPLTGVGIAYGVEFSPDGSKLYVSSTFPAQILQFDLLAGSQFDVAASGLRIASMGPGLLFEALSLGPDWRIYVAKLDAGELGVIANPNARGAACTYIASGVSLGGRQCKAGLPNFMARYYPNFKVLNPCSGDLTNFVLSDTSDIDSVLWNFGDPESGKENISRLLRPVHSYSKAGRYSVSFTMYSLGEIYTNTVEIIVYQGVRVSLGNDRIVCRGGTVTLDAGNVSGLSYLWSNGARTSSITVGQAGQYWASVSNGNCSASDTIEIMPAEIKTAVRPDTTICLGGSAQMWASGGAEYRWSPPEGLSRPDIANPVASPVMTTTYNLTITDTNGCSARHDIRIVVDDTRADAGRDVSILPGESIAIGRFLGDHSYRWSPVTDLSDPDNATPTAKPGVTTSYIVTVTTKNGCVSTDTMTVSVGELAAKVSPDVTICRGGSTRLVAEGGRDYRWSPATGLSDPDIADPVASPDVTTRYSVIVSLGDKRDTVYVTVTVNELPFAKAGDDADICFGGSIMLGEQAKDGFRYKWRPSEGLSSDTVANPVASPVSATRYHIIVSKGDCISEDSVLVSVRGKLTARAEAASPAICRGSSTQLKAEGGAIYRWKPAAGLSNPDIAEPVASPDTTTVYTLVVTDQDGSCSDSTQITLTVHSLPVPSAGRDTTICIGDVAELRSEGGDFVSYSWKPDTDMDNSSARSPKVRPQSSTDYTVTVTDANGCEASDIVRVIVEAKKNISYTLSSDDKNPIPGENIHLYLDIACDKEGLDSFALHINYPDKVFRPLTGTIKALSGFSGWNINASAIQPGTVLLHGAGTALHSGKIGMELFTLLDDDKSTAYPVELRALTDEGCVNITLRNTGISLGPFCDARFRPIMISDHGFSLSAAQPNPAAGETLFAFSIAFPAQTKLSLYNSVGEEVRMLCNEYLQAGDYSRKLSLAGIPSGIYYYRIDSGVFTASEKLIITE